MIIKLWCITDSFDYDSLIDGNHALEQIARCLHGKIRDEFLNERWFYNLTDSRQQAEEYKHLYNTDREHSSLGWLTPVEFKQKLASTLSA